LTRELLRKCEVEDVEQLVGVMALFSGAGVWGADAVGLVFEEVERVGGDFILIWGFEWMSVPVTNGVKVFAYIG
jgi:hypothetical protein